MKFSCTQCNIELTEYNSARNGVRNGRIRFRKQCKRCHSKRVVSDAAKDIIKRRSKAAKWLIKSGRVKLYPCERCSTPCYKKYKKAFCSDMCRFMFYVQITDQCWIWNGCKDQSNYGLFSFRGIKAHRAHRTSYILFRGDIPKNILVCHTCDNPSCVNPQHLFLGTTQHNTEDMVQKGRSLKGELHNKSKLKTEDIIKIRELHKEGIKQTDIAELFNVFAGHINNIIKRRVWKHIT